jgi:transcription antitermination factor NusG
MWTHTELSERSTSVHLQESAAECPVDWYAVYTRSRHEKRIQEQCEQRSIEAFLPLYETIHRWKDRRMKVHLPLFPGYIFVRILLQQRLSVLQIPGAVSLVGFGGSPTALPKEEIEALQKGLSSKVRAAPHPYLTIGRRVSIAGGPLAGLRGVLLRRKGKCRMVLSIDLLRRSIVVDVDRDDLELSSGVSRPTLVISDYTAVDRGE